MVHESEWDVFISHASEDKSDVARQLTQLLTEMGLRVWLDENELRMGDSLRRKIDEGLSKSIFGVVVLSKQFFAKNWPKRELDGLISLETDRRKVILPIWRNVTHEDVRLFSPIFADKYTGNTVSGLDTVVKQVAAIVREARPG